MKPYYARCVSMLTCPLDFRYGRKEMKAIFSEDHRIDLQLKVEAALARAHAKVGTIPRSAAEEITAKASIAIVPRERVSEIEAETKHDVMAMVKALSERCGDSGRYVHLGATSNDIIDTTTALQLKAALDIIEADLLALLSTFADLAERHRTTICMGRTHGQNAIPTTYGFKVAGYASEVMRHLERLREGRRRVCVGKLSGAIGTAAALGPKARQVQAHMMKDLGLGYEEAATQVVCRDRYAELVCLMAIICTSCERYATEVRNLQRSEIAEVAEPFDTKRQVGSSTMAQKRNPIVSENVCGLSRIVRGFVPPTFENMVLWHERDLTNSSAERFTLPHVMILTDDILVKMEGVYRGLTVNEGNMLRNIKAAKGMIMAEPVMMALTSKGLGRQEAHEIVRSTSMLAEEKGWDLERALWRNPVVRKHLTKEELASVMDPANYLGSAPEMTDAVVAKARKLLQ
ncbi:MAG TPA: adenylosuccinate lyase [Methanomassiliicoccales archaeon]|nr:adenylosuccinate lyase [Methanomassiliicoccales archaeon]